MRPSLRPALRDAGARPSLRCGLTAGGARSSLRFALTAGGARSSLRFALAAAGAITAAAGAGCGGEPDEEQQVQQVVRDFAKANTQSDGKAFCALVTRDFRERLTGATGEAVDEQCVKQVDALKSRRIEVVRIDEPRVKGDNATVTAELDFSGQRQLRTLRLRREDGKFRLTEG